MLPALPDYPIDDTHRHRVLNEMAPYRRHRSVLVAVVLVFVVAGLALASWHDHFTSVDRETTARVVQPYGSSGFVAADDVSMLGSGPVVGVSALVFGAIVWLRTRDPRAALLVPVATITAGIVESIGNIVIRHPRPLTATLTGESGFGFPSGHTTGFMALVLTVCATIAFLKHPNTRRWTGWPIALAAAAVMAASRVVTGAQYVFDVVAGLGTGSLCAIATVHLLPGMSGLISRARTKLTARQARRSALSAPRRPA